MIYNLPNTIQAQPRSRVSDSLDSKALAALYTHIQTSVKQNSQSSHLYYQSSYLYFIKVATCINQMPTCICSNDTKRVLWSAFLRQSAHAGDQSRRRVDLKGKSIIVR